MDSGKGVPLLKSWFSAGELHSSFNDANCPFFRCILLDKFISSISKAPKSRRLAEHVSV